MLPDEPGHMQVRVMGPAAGDSVYTVELECGEEHYAAPNPMNDDENLVKRVISGDATARREFVHLYQHVVYRALGRYRQLSPEDINDLFQDVFERLLQDGSRALRRWSGGSLPAYLRTITRNLANDFCTGRRPEVPLEDPQDPEGESAIPSDEPEPDATLLSEQLRRMMRDAKARLSADHMEVLDLLYVQDLSYKEIADLLGCSTSLVGVRAMRARDRLLAVIRQEFPALASYL